MKAIIKFKNELVEIPDVKKVSRIGKFLGLMFGDSKASALLFEFPKPTRQAIHSLFCPDFLAIWLDEENKIIEYKLVLGNKLSIIPEKEFSKLIEIPLNEKYSQVTKLFITK